MRDEISLIGYFDRNEAVRVLTDIHRFQETGLGEVIININSPGGFLFGALRVVSALNILGARTVSVCENAGSSAALIFLACHMRVIKPNGKLMLHPIFPVPGVSHFEGKQVNWGEREVVLASAYQRAVNNLIIRKTSMSPVEVGEIMSKHEGRVFTADEAVRLGLAHKIAG